MKRTLFGLVVAAVALSANAGDDMKTGFKDLDANSDGKLSSAEVSSQSTLSKDFKTLDSDGDGAIERVGVCGLVSEGSGRYGRAQADHEPVKAFCWVARAPAPAGARCF